MNLSNTAARGALLVAIGLTLAACSGGSTSRIDYKEAKSLPSLDVPPDLTAPEDSGTENMPVVGGGADTAGRDSGESAVLPLAHGVEIAHAGRIRWLVIDTPAERLWPRLRQFWSSIGLEIRRDEPAIGIMETNWAENLADTPSGFLSSLVKSVFKNAYSADTRDKYRIRLEPRSDGRTELFVTHYGLKEVVAGQTADGFVDTAWQIRPSDLELANEVLNRLILFLGGDEKTAEAVRASRSGKIVESEQQTQIEGDVLLLEEGFSRAWRLTGLALDRIGLVVEDRNRSEGVYYVSHVNQLADAGVEEEGWFTSLFSADDAETAAKRQWQVHISGGEQRSRIRIRDEQGAEVDPKLSQSILKRLQESLR